MEDKQLVPFLNHQKIVMDLCTQLSKDLGVEELNVTVVFPSSNVFEQLFNQIYPYILSFEKSNKAKLNFILNRADISENQLKREIQKNKNTEYPRLLTELIIKRELQKVVIRNSLT